MTSQTGQDEVKRWVSCTADVCVNISRCVSVWCNSTFALMHIQLIPLILRRLIIQRSFTVETFNYKSVCEGGNLWSVTLNLYVSKWRALKIGLFHEPLAVQIQKIPSKLNGRKLKPSSNMSQEICWSDSSRTAGIFGTFVWSTSKSISEKL